MTMLSPGEQVRLETHHLPCEIVSLLGDGGQGEVYRTRVQRPESVRDYALKWYFPHTATDDQLHVLRNLVKEGPPNERFLWPLDLASIPQRPGFGYLMQIRDDRFRGIHELMNATIESSFRALAIAGFQLADGFWQLHAKGFCYRDINFGNVFIDPDRGDVLICDNDNVGIDRRSHSGVSGTRRFMAPEVERGEALPSAATDLHSLAVLLFYMFVVHHPLEGRRELEFDGWDPATPLRLYGTEPLFVFDPRDRSNEPVAGEHDNALTYWPLLPGSLRDLFTQAFTEGLHDPQNGRVRENIWSLEMVRMHDAIVDCAHCQEENFWDDGHGPAVCWRCQQAISLPPRIVFNEGTSMSGTTVMLNFGAKLLPHHLRAGAFDFEEPPVGEVVRHPRRADIWGLRNLTRTSWQATTADGDTEDVLPERSVTLAPGTRVRFGTVEAVIRF